MAAPSKWPRSCRCRPSAATAVVTATAVVVTATAVVVTVMTAVAAVAVTAATAVVAVTAVVVTATAVTAATVMVVTATAVVAVTAVVVTATAVVAVTAATVMVVAAMAVVVAVTAVVVAATTTTVTDRAGEPTRYDADVADSVQTIVVDVVGGAPVGGVQRVKVDLGSVVALMVTSDGAEEVHVHGYDILRGVSEGNPAHFAMTAEIPGVFEVELEGSGRLLLQLEIS